MEVIKSLTKEMVKEIGNKSREFYEFILPPVDMYLEEDKLILLVDMPGFGKKNIKLSLDKNIISIKACKEVFDKNKHNMICNQRPSIIDKKIRLPVELKEGDESVTSAKYEQGVLMITIQIQQKGKNITVE